MLGDNCIRQTFGDKVTGLKGKGPDRSITITTYDTLHLLSSHDSLQSSVLVGSEALLGVA